MFEKEKAQAKIIRERLKREGFGFKQVSIRTIYPTYHPLMVLIVVTIKDETIDINYIKEIIGKYNFASFDMYSKDVIKGYKTFFDICYEYSVWKKLQRFRNKSKKS